MSVSYYDCTSSGTAGTYYTAASSCTASQYNVSYAATGTAATTFTIYVPAPRRVLVILPKHWVMDDAKALARLLNAETRTGCTVEMILTGDVVITDPTIETRTLLNIIPLINSMASAEDRQKIDAFFVEHDPNEKAE